jgi:hypothetical protein
MDSDSDTTYPQCARPDRPTPEFLDVQFEDGNFTVKVGEKTFRIYAGVLATMSSVFRDMFQVSKVLQQERVDGWPVVHLAGDSAADIECIHISFSQYSLLTDI